MTKNASSFITIIFYFLTLTSTVHASPNEKPSVKVKVHKIQEHEFYEKYYTTAQFKHQGSKTVTSQVNAVVDFIIKDEKRSVQQGDVVLKMDEKIAEGIIEKARFSLEEAKSSYKRDETLYKKKVISSDLFDKSKVNLKNTELEYAKALKQYDEYIVKAPFDAKIGVIKARINDNVKIGDYLLSFIKDSSFSGFANLPEKLIGQIDETSLVEIIDIDSLNNCQARIESISGYLNEYGIVDAKITTSKECILNHGGSYNLLIKYNHHNALAIPEKTVMRDNSGYYVYKIDSDNQVKKVVISSGTKTDGYSEILSGDLSLSDQIVTEGLTKVSENSKVEVLD